MFTIQRESPVDLAARETLLDEIWHTLARIFSAFNASDQSVQARSDEIVHINEARISQSLRAWLNFRFAMDGSSTAFAASDNSFVNGPDCQIPAMVPVYRLAANLTKGSPMFQIVRCALDDKGEVTLRRPLHPLFELREDALAMAEFDASRLWGDYGYDEERSCWWASDSGGRVYRFEVKEIIMEEAAA